MVKKFPCIIVSCFMGVALVIGGCGNATPATSNNNDQAKLTVEQIAQLSGPDREQKLIEGAKKEGKLVWYTALIANQAVEPMIKAFEQKYPFIQVTYYRGNSGDTIQKVETAYKAKKYDIDVVDGSNPPVVLKQDGLTVPFYSPSIENYPPQLKDSQHYWAATNVYFMALGYNTKLVPPGTEPKTYDDLLNDKWKGKMAWGVGEGAGSASAFIGNILTSMGEEKGMEYLKQLSHQQIHNVASSARAVLDQVIAGQYPIALEIFDNHPVISAKQGAPVSWVPLQPVPAFENDICILKNAPHPYAAMLFLDFILGKEGQSILQNADYLPANPDVPPKDPTLVPKTGHFTANFINPETAADKASEWNKVFNQLFLNNQK